MSELSKTKEYHALINESQYNRVVKAAVVVFADAAIAELDAEVQHQVERREEEKLRAVNAEAALAERDRMLRVARERDFTHLGDYETWFNDVKLSARAEAAKP